MSIHSLELEVNLLREFHKMFLFHLVSLLASILDVFTTRHDGICCDLGLRKILRNEQENSRILASVSIVKA